MKLTIEIDCDNDAFHADVAGEIRWILTFAIMSFAKSVSNGELPIKIPLLDSNGNRVGLLEYIDNNEIKTISEEDARFAGIIE